MTSMQQSNVDAEWKPEFLFTAIFGETNQVKCEKLPERIKEFKPETSKFFSTNKGKKNVSDYLLLFAHGCPMSLVSRDLTYYISAFTDRNR